MSSSLNGTGSQGPGKPTGPPRVSTGAGSGSGAESTRRGPIRLGSWGEGGYRCFHHEPRPLPRGCPLSTVVALRVSRPQPMGPVRGSGDPPGGRVRRRPAAPASPALRAQQYLQIFFVLVDVVELEHVGVLDELQDGDLSLHLHRQSSSRPSCPAAPTGAPPLRKTLRGDAPPQSCPQWRKKSGWLRVRMGDSSLTTEAPPTQAR